LYFGACVRGFYRSVRDIFYMSVCEYVFVSKCSFVCLYVFL